MLTFRNLSVARGKTQLLDGVSGSIQESKITGLVAPNGSGKTTLMQVLIGSADIAAAGRIEADGVPVWDEKRYRKLVFYVPGDASYLYALLTVRENLCMAKACWNARYDIDALARRCGIDGFMNKRVRALSLGMKQQVALAVGYMTGAKYLLLDEPMNALDPSNLLLNSKILRSLRKGGRGMLMSSHILGNIDDLCDDVLFIKDGALEHVDAARGAASSMETYQRLFVTGGDVRRRG